MHIDQKILEQKLAEIEAEIMETMKRLPAHSVKPPVMLDLFRLEDEKDLILEQLNAMKNGQGKSL